MGISQWLFIEYLFFFIGQLSISVSGERKSMAWVSSYDSEDEISSLLLHIYRQNETWIEFRKLISAIFYDRHLLEIKNVIERERLWEWEGGRWKDVDAARCLLFPPNRTQATLYKQTSAILGEEGVANKLEPTICGCVGCVGRVAVYCEPHLFIQHTLLVRRGSLCTLKCQFKWWERYF